MLKMRTETPGSAGSSPAVTEPVRHVLNGPTMGTRYSAIFFASPAVSPVDVHTALKAAVGAVDMQMSTWKPDSRLMHINRGAVGEWVSAPAELLLVLATALQIGRDSEGAFDIGVGDLVGAWGFGPHRIQPDPAWVERLETVPRLPAHEALELDLPARRLRKHAPLALDLSGIAKGFGVDQLAGTLERFGVSDYLVSIDGEVRAGGYKPGGLPWRVAVERPDRTARDIAGVVELTDSALATSGSYRHSVEADGRLVSHTMDPRTRRPAVNGIAAVTVQAPSCMLADAWATALLVLGPEEGLRLAGEHGLDALYAVEESA